MNNEIHYGLPFNTPNPSLRKYGPCTKGRIIIIEGLISAGKSTAGVEICNFLNRNKIKAKFFPEPLIPDLLQLFLSNQEKYAFAFQLAMLVKRQTIYKEAYRLTQLGYCCIIDRSLYGDYCFALMHKHRGNISDHVTLNIEGPTEWKSYINILHSDNFEPPDYVVYLKVTPDVAVKRCKKRDRDGEKAYDIEYFVDLCDIYDKVIPQSPTNNMLVIDWNKDRSDNKNKIVIDILDQIKSAYDKI